MLKFVSELNQVSDKVHVNDENRSSNSSRTVIEMGTQDLIMDIWLAKTFKTLVHSRQGNHETVIMNDLRKNSVLKS